MKISKREESGVIVFELEGRVDSAGAVELDEALQASAAEGHYKTILDMGQVQYINSAGLRTLADILTQNRTHGGDLRLVALNPKVERVFKIIGFDKFFDTYDDVQTAIADLIK
ncbi:MAG: STAS domain-containing protein [Chloroflexi bacterium]|nr:STAS domain-containing protein [Chloroflexota bacterium]